MREDGIAIGFRQKRPEPVRVGSPKTTGRNKGSKPARDALRRIYLVRHWQMHSLLPGSVIWREKLLGSTRPLEAIRSPRFQVG